MAGRGKGAIQRVETKSEDSEVGKEVVASNEKVRTAGSQEPGRETCVTAEKTGMTQSFQQQEAAPYCPNLVFPHSA